ncbi:hypothetical protein CR513_51715, partial [Mucuna pruriens]
MRDGSTGPTIAAHAHHQQENPQLGDKWGLLEERPRAIEGTNHYGFEGTNLCLVPNMVIPNKFKVPDFDKYKGSYCSRTHLVILVGATLSWYLGLERGQIQMWRNLVKAFLKQYKYNEDMVPDHTRLQNMLKCKDKNFKEYAQRWREIATQVQPLPLEKEMGKFTHVGTGSGSRKKSLTSEKKKGEANTIVFEMGPRHDKTSPTSPPYSTQI